MRKNFRKVSAVFELVQKLKFNFGKKLSEIFGDTLATFRKFCFRKLVSETNFPKVANVSPLLGNEKTMMMIIHLPLHWQGYREIVGAGKVLHNAVNGYVYLSPIVT